MNQIGHSLICAPPSPLAAPPADTRHTTPKRAITASNGQVS